MHGELKSIRQPFLSLEVNKMTTINFYDVDVALNGEGGKLNSSSNRLPHTPAILLKSFYFIFQWKKSFVKLKVGRKSRVAVEWDVDCCDPPEEKP